MSMVDEMSIRRRQILVGRTKKLLDEGRSVKEIREKLKLSESTVRSLVATCEKAETDRQNTTDDIIE